MSSTVSCENASTAILNNFLIDRNTTGRSHSKTPLTAITLQYKVYPMQSEWAAENLQVIRTLMERSAVYRRALAPLMGAVGATGLLAALGASLVNARTARAFAACWLAVGIICVAEAFLLIRRQALKEADAFWSPPTRRVAQALS